MVSSSEIPTCYFAEVGFNNTCICRCLDVKTCDGHNTKCTFYKTAEEYHKNRDNAIDVCRKKHLCARCRYVDTPCMKSTERRRDDAVL